MRECASITENLPEGQGQLARALYKLSVLSLQQGREKQGREYRKRAEGIKAKVTGNVTSEELSGEAAEAQYNDLNPWMLW